MDAMAIMGLICCVAKILMHAANFLMHACQFCRTFEKAYCLLHACFTCTSQPLVLSSSIERARALIVLRRLDPDCNLKSFFLPLECFKYYEYYELTSSCVIS